MNATPITPDGDDDRRYRPRTFPYFDLLPYPVEDESARDTALDRILGHLYVAIRAEDFAPGALFWSRQLQNWMSLKFEMPRALRATLTRIFYHLATAPGIDDAVSDRFVRMVISLTRKHHYLKPGRDLILDWRPLWHEFKLLVLPREVASHQATWRRPHKQIWKLCLHAQVYFDPAERREILTEFLPLFSASDISSACISLGLINVLLPTEPAPVAAVGCQPQDILPGLFHVWALVARARAFDVVFVDLFSRLARGHLSCEHVPFSEYGIFTRDQSNLIFTAILRLTEIPVGQSGSPYTALDHLSGFGIYLEKDRKKHPIASLIAHWIVNSLSPLCLERNDSILSSLQGLLESVDTFFHPSNHGVWTMVLCQLVYFLTDLFMLRWNREQSGELDVPAERRITPALRARFVLCLREVTFMGLFSKGSRVASFYYSTLQGLAYLEPSLILPGALQRFYPSLEGVVEVHRTTSSLNGLQVIANVMARQHGFRCHLTALLALALPGIDANDLGKTHDTLNLIQAVAYSIPLVPLVREGDVQDTSLATEWVRGELERMELEGSRVRIDYEAELSVEVEESILRSSTAGLGMFVVALLDKVFSLLENMPESSNMRSGSPEDNVINALPSALSALFTSLSPDLFEVVVEKLADFVSTHVLHQVRDAMAWIVGGLCRANPRRALRALVPMLVDNIRNEIETNGAASDRSSGSDFLPRDRALVWYLGMLGMAVVHVGDEVLRYQDELEALAGYLQTRCRGLPAIHVSNFVHHLLMNLTRAYPIDHGLYEPAVVARGIGPADWGQLTPPGQMSIQWYVPSQAGLVLAVKVFQAQVRFTGEKLDALMGDMPPVRRSGKHKEWSDDVVRLLQQVRLVIAGVAALFDPVRAVLARPAFPTRRKRRRTSKKTGLEDDEDHDAAQRGPREVEAEAEEEGEEVEEVEGEEAEDEEGQKGEDVDHNDGLDDDDADHDHVRDDSDALAEPSEDDHMSADFRYRAGYVLSRDDEGQLYGPLHASREELGRLLSRTHVFLCEQQPDDVACFTALYAAYRTWLTDVGMERSAHGLERQLRLYKADTGNCKISGQRKAYPRPLLVKRAEAYHLARVKHNAAVRRMGPLDRQLLLLLAESCLSSYTDVRRSAQSALESSHKALIGSRPLVIPGLLGRLGRALAEDDHDRIKGGMYTLLYGSLARTLVKDWRFAPDAVRLYIRTAAIDKSSIQQLGNGVIGSMLEFGRPLIQLAVVDRNVVEAIRPTAATATAAKAQALDERIAARNRFMRLRRQVVETAKGALGLELTRMAAGEDVHWKMEARCVMMANNLIVRFKTIAPAEFIELVVQGAIDRHPSLRVTYATSLSAVFSTINMRSIYDHHYRNFVLGLERDDKRVRVPVPVEVVQAGSYHDNDNNNDNDDKVGSHNINNNSNNNGDDGSCKNDGGWTQQFLQAFGQPARQAQYLVDVDYPGWLVWGRDFTAVRWPLADFGSFDETEQAVRQQLGRRLTRGWLEQFVEFARQEPRELAVDRLIVTHTCVLMHVFDLMHCGGTALQLDDVREVAVQTYDDGTDRHRHRATAELLAALLVGSSNNPARSRDQVWAFAVPMLLGILANDLTAENQPYWMACVHMVAEGKDPRRYAELSAGLARFRLDRESNAAFKDAARLTLLESVVVDGGWRFGRGSGAGTKAGGEGARAQAAAGAEAAGLVAGAGEAEAEADSGIGCVGGVDVDAIRADLLAHLDHPYKSVREAMGRLLAALYRTRYHESWASVDKLLAANKRASSIGLRPYQVTDRAELRQTVLAVFAQLERWRQERPAGQQTQSAYTSGCKTVLTWLDVMLSSHECTLLAPFFAWPMVEQLMYMMDVKEDPELMRLAYRVYRHLPNVPVRPGEEGEKECDCENDGADSEVVSRNDDDDDDDDDEDSNNNRRSHGHGHGLTAALTRVGRSSASWHQRLRSLINLQVLYFRRIFLLAERERDLIFAAVGDMLADAQPEVRLCAANTLAGMIRCSPGRVRDPVIGRLKARFEAELRDNPMVVPASMGTSMSASMGSVTPAASIRLRDLLEGGGGGGSGYSTPRSGSGSESPRMSEAVRRVRRRHAAVLGLGALIEAFPYATPPLAWMPGVLARLATGPVHDPGVVGRAAKTILADFKKTRQDSWGVVQKYFTKGQLEDLEGVLWKSYFA